MIHDFHSPEFDSLCRDLVECRSDDSTLWPKAQLDKFAVGGVYHWFIERELGGLEWSSRDLTAAYVRLSESCLASTFVLTQRIAALRRIARSPLADVRQKFLPEFLSGKATATVGISHLTTSRRHLNEPAVKFRPHEGGFAFDGTCPWVTGANDTAYVMVGAEAGNGDQVLGLVPTQTNGVTVKPGFEMMALTNTHTGAVKLDSVFLPDDHIVAGPIENVLSTLGDHSTGSYQTSALALGLSSAAIRFLEQESERRTDLIVGAESLREQYDQQLNRLLDVTGGNPICSNELIRTEANSLVLRATQAAMVAAKGAGFIATHPVSRWCREAMFFLVWSCPQAVRDANLCELAGID